MPVSLYIPFHFLHNSHHMTTPPTLITSSARSIPLVTSLLYLHTATVHTEGGGVRGGAYEEGGFLATAAPTDGSSSRHVLRECVSSSSYNTRGPLTTHTHTHTHTHSAPAQLQSC